MGLSSRPSPELLNSPATASIPSRVARAENFFLSSLESWRESVGVDKMVIVGHSLGGYLASAYAVRYPHRVSGLVLVSPAGIPHGPDYKKYHASGEQNESDLDGAVDAAEQEMNENQFEAKGEAKQWQRNREESATRRYMMMCESISDRLWVWNEADGSLRVVLGKGRLAILLPSQHGTMGTNVRSEIYPATIRLAIRRGQTEYSRLYL